MYQPGRHEDCGCGWHGRHIHGEGWCTHVGHEPEEWEEGHGWGGCYYSHPIHRHQGHGPFGGYPGSYCWRGGGGEFGFRRRFRGRAEVIEKLEDYLRDLEAEAQAVREKLEKLRSTGSTPQEG